MYKFTLAGFDIITYTYKRLSRNSKECVALFSVGNVLVMWRHAL